mmetsp:Transcript_10284/g.12062  ORF Transcript_10284/g.12062 Transcript_10284/m.12062 type:complete len:100 (-) Transcript_10284:449-748(-)
MIVHLHHNHLLLLDYSNTSKKRKKNDFSRKISSLIKSVSKPFSNLRLCFSLPLSHPHNPLFFFLIKYFLQFSTLVHTCDDITSTNKFTVDIELRNCGPL